MLFTSKLLNIIIMKLHSIRATEDWHQNMCIDILKSISSTKIENGIPDSNI